MTIERRGCEWFVVAEDFSYGPYSSRYMAELILTDLRADTTASLTKRQNEEDS